jgi:hypothetical protein
MKMFNRQINFRRLTKISTFQKTGYYFFVNLKSSYLYGYFIGNFNYAHATTLQANTHCFSHSCNYLMIHNPASRNNYCKLTDLTKKIQG